MGGCRCSYRNCKSATKLNGDLHFFHYPVKHRERCNQWIKNARRPEFCNLPDDQLRNKVVCDLHFEPKYFTNVLRKRLVHNAVPTIQVGDDNISENSSELKDVQILPANDDGTIFTLDTDSMQQKSDAEPISTYSFRNGALVPVFSEEQNDTEQVLYTIDEEDLKPVSYREQSGNANNYLFIDPNRPEQASESYEIVFNGDTTSSHISYERKPPRSHSPVFVEYQRKNFVANQSRSSSQDTMEVVYITEHEERANSPVIVKTDPDAVTIEPLKPRNIKPIKAEYKVRENHNHNRPSHIFKKRVISQVKQNCREIALIKRTLKANLNRSRKFNINNLRGKVSSTLLGALSLNLYNKKSNFTSDEFEFLTTLYKLSPDMYSMFYEKLGWNLPNPSIVEELLQK